MVTYCCLTPCVEKLLCDSCWAVQRGNRDERDVIYTPGASQWKVEEDLTEHLYISCTYWKTTTPCTSGQKSISSRLLSLCRWYWTETHGISGNQPFKLVNHSVLMVALCISLEGLELEQMAVRLLILLTSVTLGLTPQILRMLIFLFSKLHLPNIH